jgi:hypothetical protein
MLRTFPQFCPTVSRTGGILWRGTLQPSAESPLYRLRIVHEPHHVPQVFVECPQLRADAPHRYRDGSLCLYWPGEWQWRSGESLAATIVPWAAMWLYYYETWLVTDEWCGPASPHGNSNPEVSK